MNTLRTHSTDFTVQTLRTLGAHSADFTGDALSPGRTVETVGAIQTGKTLRAFETWRASGTG